MNIGKAFSDNLMYVGVGKNTEISNAEFGKKYRGDKYCTAGQKCLKYLTNDDIYDIFNTSISITSSIEDTFNITLSLSLEGSDTESLEICKNVIRVAQQNSHILLYVSSVSNNEEEGGYNAKIFYGDKECNGNRICLRSISLDNIYELCTYHTDKKNQHFKIEFLRS